MLMLLAMSIVLFLAAVLDIPGRLARRDLRKAEADLLYRKWSDNLVAETFRRHPRPQAMKPDLFYIADTPDGPVLWIYHKDYARSNLKQMHVYGRC